MDQSSNNGDSRGASVSKADLGDHCALGCEPGVACAVPDDSCPDHFCVFDGRAGSTPAATCTASCDTATCPDGYTCEMAAHSSAKVCVPKPGSCGDGEIQGKELCDDGVGRAPKREDFFRSTRELCYRGMSDREAVDAFVFDGRWKYAAGLLDFDHPGFVHTVLVDMRARLRRPDRPNPRARSAAELLATVLGQDLEMLRAPQSSSSSGFRKTAPASPSSGKTVRPAHSVHSAPIQSAAAPSERILKHDTLDRSRRAQRDPACKQRYRIIRPKVERKLAHMMRREHGGRRAGVRGRLRVAHDFALLAAAINLRWPCGSGFARSPLKKTSSSRALCRCYARSSPNRSTPTTRARG